MTPGGAESVSANERAHSGRGTNERPGVADDHHDTVLL